MKFSIAAKLGLLAAFVSLVATGLVGWWTLSQARSVLTDHELANLTDETELRIYELVNDFRYLRRDVRELANPPARAGKENLLRTPDWISQLIGSEEGIPPADLATQARARKQLEKAFRELLAREENYYYLELVAVRIHDENQQASCSPVLALSRRRTGEELQSLDLGPEAEPLLSLMQQEPLRELLKNANTARTSRLQMFPPQARRHGPSAADEEGYTPMLLTVGYPISRETTGMPHAYLFLTVDFEEFLRYRFRHSPRHLVYLADDDGRLLFHPNREVQRELRRLSARKLTDLPSIETRTPLSLFAPLFELRKSAYEQQMLRKQRGAASSEPLQLPDTFHYTEQRIERPHDRKKMGQHWKDLRERLAELARSYPELRYSVPSPASKTLEISCPRREDLDAVQKEVLSWQREQGWDTTAWLDPVQCQTFAVHFMLLNPDLDSRDRPRPRPELDEGKAPPRFFGLALATGLEEIQQDIHATTAWMIPVVLALAGGASLAAWWFSRILTRPLGRIIHATQHVAAGSVDSELPEPLPVESRDEIGILARAFEEMRVSLRHRRDALYENIARMRAILETAAEGIVIFDEHGNIESFNQAAETIFGYQAADIHQQKISLLLDVPKERLDRPDWLEGGAGSLLSAPATDSVRIVQQVVKTRGEVVGRRKDGTTFPMEVAFSEVPLQGRKVVTGIFRDITDRKKAEEEIHRANEELERRVRLRTEELEQAMLRLETMLQGAQETSKAKDDFMAKVSHELRTPLNAIIGYSELLIEGLLEDQGSDADNASLLNDLTRILTAGKHLNDLISDILEFRAFLEGKLRLIPAEFPVSSLLDTIRSLAPPLASRNANRLVFDISGDLGVTCNEAKRLKQILLNLLSNACKFTEKGTVTFHAHRESDGLGQDCLVFSVQDTGPGMTPKEMGKLFNPYYRVDDPKLKDKPGTGLGLAISKSFCEMMGGIITVQSEKGKGTTFTVRVPAIVEVREPEAPTRPAPPKPDRKWSNVILIIDDDDDARETIARQLVREGLAVQTADSGEQGLRLARELHPVAITLDAIMPGMDGWTVLAALKNDPLTADIPVVMLTIEDNPRRGFALGASDYLTKPIDWPRLSAVLHAHCPEQATQPVLVVEDDENSRNLVCRLLEREGRSVVSAENGRVALDLLEGGLRPALILLDLMMPQMDGFEFLEEIRSRPELQELPVVVVTARELTSEDRQRLNGSVAAILNKNGFSPEQLLSQLRERVRQYLRGNSRLTGVSR